jgi:hypothetical protein
VVLIPGLTVSVEKPKEPHANSKAPVPLFVVELLLMKLSMLPKQLGMLNVMSTVMY